MSEAKPQAAVQVPAPAVQRQTAKSSHRTVYLTAVVVMLLTTVPYIYGWSLQGNTPQRGWYSGFGYNVSDSCVYTSWMRHAAEGHFFEYNLFTTGQQYGKKFNIFYFLLGTVMRLSKLSPAVVYHLVRLVLGIVFLRAVWWLLEQLVHDRRARWAAFLCVIFSAGLGWISKAFDLTRMGLPTDLWQPEGFTFLCLYWSPLFLVSLLLMIGMIGFLFVAEQRGTWRHAIYAGLCALLLGNVHTYDIIPTGIAWAAFLIMRALFRRRVSMDDLRSVGRGAIVAGMGAVSAGYQYYVLLTEPTFASRVNVATLSPPISCYLWGYGLTLLLCVAGIVLAVVLRLRTPLGERLGIRNDAVLLLSVWVISSFIAAYSMVPGPEGWQPVSFQRKLLMGVHIPMAVLAGVAVAWAIKRFQGVLWAAALVTVVVLLSPSNWWFLYNDMRDMRNNSTGFNSVRLYLYDGEVRALRWLGGHTPPGTVIQPLPWIEAPRPGPQGSGMTDGRGRQLTPYLSSLPDGRTSLMPFSDGRGGSRPCATFDTSVACFAPTLAGRMVNVGHPGESGTDYRNQVLRWGYFVMPYCTDAERLRMLQESGVRYVIFSQKHDETGDSFTEQSLLSVFRGTPPSYLHRIDEASNLDADVYEAVLPPGTQPAGR